MNLVYLNCLHTTHLSVHVGIAREHLVQERLFESNCNISKTIKCLSLKKDSYRNYIKKVLGVCINLPIANMTIAKKRIFILSAVSETM